MRYTCVLNLLEEKISYCKDGFLSSTFKGFSTQISGEINELYIERKGKCLGKTSKYGSSNYRHEYGHKVLHALWLHEHVSTQILYWHDDSEMIKTSEENYMCKHGKLDPYL